eukprot:g3502.t1
MDFQTPELATDQHFKRTRIQDKWLQITTSMVCIGVYVWLGAANIIILALELTGNGQHISVKLFEAFINIVLFGEVFVNIVLFRKQFFRDPVNILDLVITILCFAFFVVFMYEEGVHAGFSQLTQFDAVLIACRYILLVMRFCIIVRNGRQRSKILTQDNVEFANSDPAISLAELRSQSVGGSAEENNNSDVEAADPKPQFLAEDHDDEEDEK